ncbi:MAG: hypothetical protein LBT23_01570 [Synergistaceae bacterium]|jgi:hypothetical protein|nr:hypothetical protein [Synergistaceae bacterium]
MDSELGLKIYIIVKGYIDAKDDKGNTLYGTILGVASRRDVMYLSTMFSRETTPKSLEWNELLYIHRDRKAGGDRDPAVVHHEEELFKYLQRGAVLNNVAKNRNTKQAEQAISRFCLENLQLKAVSLIEYFDASDSDIILFENDGGAASGSSTGGKQPEREEPDTAAPEVVVDDDITSEEEETHRDEIVIRCEPILDPVRGVAMNELNVGEKVMVKLPEDSVFFKLLSRNIKGFDGIVTAIITGILLNELGTATISVTLSDGISGVMKLSGKVRIKVAPPDDTGKSARRKHIDIPVGVVFGASIAIILFAAIAALYYIFF